MAAADRFEREIQAAASHPRVHSLDVEVHGDIALVTGRLNVLFRQRWRQLTHHSTKQTPGPPPAPSVQGPPTMSGYSPRSRVR